MPIIRVVALCLCAAGVATAATAARAEILAMLNYETKPEDSLKALKLSGPVARREGIAIVDVDPDSETYGQILMDIPLPQGLVAHHIFFNRDASKAYVSALAKPELRVIDLTKNPYRMKTVAVPECLVGEDVVFSDDNSRWYLTCMGSNTVIVGDTASDTVQDVIATNVPYPHGIAVNDKIDRMLVTSTVRHTDLGDAGEAIGVYELSTGKPLATHKVTDKPSPAGDAPVEILFVPKAEPPIAYITNMYGGTLSTAAWDPARRSFDVKQAFDFAPLSVGVPLEIYFNDAGERMYITTAKPGHLHIFDTADPLRPKLLKTLATAEGAHHVAFTKDWRYAVVQNSFINLPGMSDGSLTLVDLAAEEVVDTIDTFKKAGLNPNLVVLLPEWNHPAGH